jgi:hypothetical protein
MRKHPKIEPNSTSRKPSPALHFRRQVGNMVPAPLRIFRDLIIFRENPAQMRNNSNFALRPSLSTDHGPPLPLAVEFLHTFAATLTQRQ